MTDTIMEMAIEYSMMTACSSRPPKRPQIPLHLIEAAERVGYRLRPARKGEYVCMICGVRASSSLGLCRHLRRSHWVDIEAMIRSELDSISSSYHDPW